MKLCVMCKHFSMDGAIGIGEETTRGEHEAIRCNAGHWAIYGIESQKQRLRNEMRAAKRCKDYDDSEEPA